MQRLRPGYLLWGLALCLPLALWMALAAGSQWASPQALWFSLSAQDGSIDALIINSIRLPRAVFAVLVGAILATAGAVMQGLFRNPLADPSLIGVNGGASLGASLALVVGLGLIGQSPLGDFMLVALGAFAGAIMTTILVYRLSAAEQGHSVAMMLLAGIAVTAFAAAVTNLLEYLASNEHLRRISIWEMGSLEGVKAWQLILLALLGVGFFALTLARAQALNALLLGESEARHLGVDVQGLKRSMIMAVALVTALVVALAGIIGFVGLIVPHVVRLLIGPNHRYLLPASALAGALLLLLADTLARTIVAPAELPVGVVTALAGAPFFISLLRQRRAMFGGSDG
ncbi:MAG: iron ABC transporter permease [Cellvibrionaceae bacterium]|nr:iron ABC transporter permease [Cellvibrionaceae bacterium]